MESEVWGQDRSWLSDDLADRLASTPGDIVIMVAEAGREIVSAGWLVTVPGTDFGGLWGGSTLPQWRRQSIYRALVARRAEIAVQRGTKLFLVDASDASRPILRRLGFQEVTTTTPWVWTPHA
ncbi:GNAT family N-acetyltransferase [Arthrobacter sp. UYCu723]